MRFANPMAWLGLVLLALPVAVHMLVRHRARIQRLPTLRFLRGDPPVAMRRSRPDEPRLLLLRMAIVALAVAALARPYLPSAESPPGGDPGASAPPNRAVLVDESWSMLRPLAGSESAGLAEGVDSAGFALGRARELAVAAAAEAPVSTVIAFGSELPLAVALEGAVAWLGARAGPGEIVLVSDFQLGTIERASAAGVPEGWGLVPIAVEVDAEATEPWTLPLRGGPVQVEAAVVDGGEVGSDAVRLTWSRSGAVGPGSPDVALVPQPEEGTLTAELLRVAENAGALTMAPGTPVRVIFPGTPADSLGGGTALAPDAASLLLRLASDRTLAAAAAEEQAPIEAASDETGEELIVARNGDGHALVTAGAAPSSGLQVQARVTPGSLTAAALLVALGRVSHLGPPGEELEPRFDDAEQRSSWARVPGPGAVVGAVAGAAEPSRTTASPAARWAWVLVLVLLVGESLYRRRVHAQRH